MTVKVELHGGPLDGMKLDLDKAIDWVRLVNRRGIAQISDVLEMDDPRVVSLDLMNYDVSCYHRSGHRPFFGRFRYHYHGPA